jgi:NAD(P)-dependent dehydrogenase (short-subunit alcohol dehydrogenase family)
MGGFQGSSKFSGLSLYSASKGALTILTECMAEELKDKDIKVNCLALGTVQTEMLDKAFPGYKARSSPVDIGEFITNFALNAHKQINGKIIPGVLCRQKSLSKLYRVIKRKEVLRRWANLLQTSH